MFWDLFCIVWQLALRALRLHWGFSLRHRLSGCFSRHNAPGNWSILEVNENQKGKDSSMKNQYQCFSTSRQMILKHMSRKAASVNLLQRWALGAEWGLDECHCLQSHWSPITDETEKEFLRQISFFDLCWYHNSPCQIISINKNRKSVGWRWEEDQEVGSVPWGGKR